MEEQRTRRQQESGQESLKSRRSNFSLYALAFLCVVLICFAILVFRKRPEAEMYVDPAQGSTFCCSNVIEKLAMSSNRSLNPCDSFFDYACFNWNLQKKEDTSSFAIWALLPPILQGSTNKSYGKTITAFYKSCISALNGGHSTLVKQAAAAVVQVSQLERPITPESMLRAIVTLSLRSFFCPIRIALMLEPPSDIPVLNITVDHDCDEQTTIYKDLKAQLLRAVNAEVASHVTSEDMMQLRNDLALVPKDATRRTGNVTALKDIALNLPLEFWKDILDKFGPVTDTVQVNIEGFRTVKKTLELLTDTQRRPAANVYPLVVAAALLCWDEFQVLVSTSEPPKVFQYCYNLIYTSNLSWYNVITEELASPTKDTVINSVFLSTRSGLVAEASNIVGSAGAVLIEAKLSRLKLILPSSIAVLQSQYITASDNMYVNVLEYYMWVHWFVMLKLTDGIPRYHIPYLKPWTTRVTKVEDYMFVPPGAYSVLNIEKGGDVVNAAILGVEIADAIWEVLFESQGWSQASQYHLATVQTCLYNLSLGRDTPTFSFPALSLQTAANNVQDRSWHRQVFVWSLWKASKSQLFYMLYAYNYACVRVIGDNSVFNVSRRSLDFLKTLPDFQNAFECSRPTWGSIDRCLHGADL